MQQKQLRHQQPYQYQAKQRNIDEGLGRSYEASTHCQVHHVQFAHAHTGFAIQACVAALYCDCEERMGARALLIHIGEANYTCGPGGKA